jgi:chromosome segregation ATPase
MSHPTHGEVVEYTQGMLNPLNEKVQYLHDFLQNSTSRLNELTGTCASNERAVTLKLDQLYELLQKAAQNSADNLQSCTTDLHSFRTLYNELVQEYLPHQFQHMYDTLQGVQGSVDMRLTQAQNQYGELNLRFQESSHIIRTLEERLSTLGRASSELHKEFSSQPNISPEYLVHINTNVLQVQEQMAQASKEILALKQRDLSLEDRFIPMSHFPLFEDRFVALERQMSDFSCFKENMQQQYQQVTHQLGTLSQKVESTTMELSNRLSAFAIVVEELKERGVHVPSASQSSNALLAPQTGNLVSMDTLAHTRGVVAQLASRMQVLDTKVGEFSQNSQEFSSKIALFGKTLVPKQRIERLEADLKDMGDILGEFQNFHTQVRNLQCQVDILTRQANLGPISSSPPLEEWQGDIPPPTSKGIRKSHHLGVDGAHVHP